MKSFKQFLIEGIVNIPGKGNVFVPDSAPTSTQNAPPPQQSPARPQTPPASQPPSAPRSVVDVDPKSGLNFNDLAEPVKDSSGNVTGYRIRANLGYDESRRPTVKGFQGPQNEVRIWKPGEGYQVFGTEQKLREFAKSHGHQLPPGDLASLMQKGEIVIPVKPTGQARQPATQTLKNIGAGGLAMAGAITGSALTQGVQAATDVLGMLGTLPPPKSRMEVEKNFNSDIGLGFDLSTEGELVLDLQGREAARKRQQRGVNFPSMFRG